jgi:hypothetical protein
MNPDHLEVDLQLLHTIQFNFGEELEDREQEVAEQDMACESVLGDTSSNHPSLYFRPASHLLFIDKEARDERERRERLMDTNPLSLMFESDEDPQRRRVLQVRETAVGYTCCGLLDQSPLILGLLARLGPAQKPRVFHRVVPKGALCVVRGPR